MRFEAIEIVPLYRSSIFLSARCNFIERSRKTSLITNEKSVNEFLHVANQPKFIENEPFYQNNSYPRNFIKARITYEISRLS